MMRRTAAYEITPVSVEDKNTDSTVHELTFVTVGATDEYTEAELLEMFLKMDEDTYLQGFYVTKAGGVDRQKFDLKWGEDTLIKFIDGTEGVYRLTHTVTSPKGVAELSITINRPQNVIRFEIKGELGLHQPGEAEDYYIDCIVLEAFPQGTDVSQLPMPEAPSITQTPAPKPEVTAAPAP